MNITKVLFLKVLFITSIFPQSLDTTFVDVNNIFLPVLNDGAIGFVNGGGKFDSLGFLWSSGFFMSGKAEDTIWSSAVLESEYFRDYLPGKYGNNINDEKNIFYIIKSSDEPFGEQWQMWKNAVDLGAYFYDGDNDGLYNPVDLNGNGEWDQEEDRPDFLGDYTAFAVYNDGIPASERYLKDSAPLGIEIKQTVFAYNEDGNNILNNVIFFRYILENVGQNNILDSVYFGVAADHDIGWYGSDLTGCDTLLNSTFGFKRIEDEDYYGINPPTFLVSLLQGPVLQSESETATVMRGPYLGDEILENSKMLGMTSSYSFDRDPLLDAPQTKEEMRYYLIGGLRADGSKIDVKNFEWGNGDFLGNSADTINPKFMFSGNPVDTSGWLNDFEFDWRFVTSTGPFLLEKGKPMELIYAYIVGRGNSPLNSVTVAKDYARKVRKFYESNFTNIPVSVNTKENIPQIFELYQNYPNPFNPATTIKYTIPFLEQLSNSFYNVELKVYDILGKEIITLVNKNQKPGSYEVNFNANNLSSGVYFYQLKIGSLIKTKKMILLR